MLWIKGNTKEKAILMMTSRWHVGVFGFLFLLLSIPLTAQQTELSELLSAGEFSVALESANAQTDANDRDRMLYEIALAQRSANTGYSAFGTLAQIQDDSMRFGGLEQLTDYGNRFGGENGFGGAAGGGQQGGVTQQDFDELIDLIQETIDPDSWEANGGAGRLRPFPSGVWVDSQGTLKLIEEDKSGRLDQLLDVKDLVEDTSFLKQTDLRKVSLARLERELQLLAAKGEPTPAEMKHLGGIYKIKYVMLYPETGDVVIAGPAGPWHYDRQGRAINDQTGQPCLNLDDLVVCLRNAKNQQGLFSCSIDPRAENLANAKQFIGTSRLTGKAFRTQLQSTLGQMDVTVDGIDPTSHAARVIVEADYRMKLAGLGVEKTVDGLKNYFDRIYLDDEGQLPQMDQLVRWWFTMNYDSVTTNSARTVFELNGQGVKLLSESEFWNERGEREHTGTSSPAASGFAADFTRRFPEIANQLPIYAELRNVFDCAIVASLIHKEGLDREINWKLHFLSGTAERGLMSYQTDSEGVPTQVDSILGQRILRHRSGSKTIKHTISGFGGGVVFDADEQTTRDKIQVVDSDELASKHQSSQPETQFQGGWSWD